MLSRQILLLPPLLLRRGLSHTPSGGRDLFHIPEYLTKVKYTPLDAEDHAACEVQVQIQDLGLKLETLEFLLRNENKHLRKRNGLLVVESALPKPKSDNKQICMEKIQRIIQHAIGETVPEKKRTGVNVDLPPQPRTEKRLEDKQHHKDIKQHRGNVAMSDKEKDSFRPQRSRFGPMNEDGTKF